MLTPEEVTLAFNDAISSRDLDRLEALMTDDHLFIDAAGTHLRGKRQVLDAWRGFFASFPEYRNVFERTDTGGRTVTATGYSICPGVDELEGPAVWTATIDGERVAVWQVSEADADPPLVA